MPTYTPNYELERPDGSEKYDITVFNDNWDILDEKIKLNEQGILAKQNTIKGAATTALDSNFIASRVIITNVDGKFAPSPITAEKLGYLSDVTSGIQGQIDAEKTARESVASIANGALTKINAYPNITISNNEPSGGKNGDIWFVYE